MWSFFFHNCTCGLREGIPPEHSLEMNLGMPVLGPLFYLSGHVLGGTDDVLR